MVLRDKSVGARPSGIGGRGNYVPARGLPVRPGSLDAFRAPSLENGQRVPRKPPVAMTSSVPQLPFGRH